MVIKYGSSAYGIIRKRRSRAVAEFIDALREALGLRPITGRWH